VRSPTSDRPTSSGCSPTEHRPQRGEDRGDLKGQFRFIGDTGAHQFLAAVGQPVPPEASRTRRAA
jgi:hypothetical protein